MATSGCKFPLPVTFDDNTPNPDFCRIILTIEEMTVRKPLIGKAQPTNTVITPSFSDSVVKVNVVVKGNQVCYEYCKPLPYNVIADRCRYEVLSKKPPRIAILLAKATRQSWAGQKKHLTSPYTN